jgi:hypothetical protein
MAGVHIVGPSSTGMRSLSTARVRLPVAGAADAADMTKEIRE